MNQEFDVLVIGGGPGGYPAAIRAAQLGKKTALVEVRELGGTCLNRGCIPSKALIASAEALNQIKKYKQFGIETGPVSFDYLKMVERKDHVVARLKKGVEGLLKANGVTVIKGFATFDGPEQVKVGDQLLKASKIILATGSEPRSLPAFPFDGEKILDSTAILEMKTVPKSLAIIGGGVIGCEFASLYHILGVEVTVIEMMPSLLPMEAQAVSSALMRIFKHQGIAFETDAKVETLEKEGSQLRLKLSNGKMIEADKCLVAVGRSMNTSKIGLEKAGINIDDKGNIPVNDKMETNVKGIYAVGDIASKWWLAHVATHQGLVAADNACGKEAHMSYHAVPSVIFTHPEIGSCGLSLEEAKKQGYDARVDAFPFQALGKAQATLETEGFSEMVIDKKTGQILGAQVIGYEASSLIAEMALAIQNELTLECIAETIHAHPTYAEGWLESAYLALETPLHLPKR